MLPFGFSMLERDGLLALAAFSVVGLSAG